MGTASCKSEVVRPEWQQSFLEIMPEIEHRLRRAFRRLDPQSREDSVENALVHCVLWYVRLIERGRAQSVTPSNLAWYAVLQVKAGREAGCRLNSKEPLCRYAQLRRGFKVVRIQSCDPSGEGWINEIIDSMRMSIADQVAARLDIAAWLATLCRRTRSIARDLARGLTTSEAASKYHVTAGRIAQIRKELKTSWQQFQGECTLERATQQVQPVRGGAR